MCQCQDCVVSGVRYWSLPCQHFYQGLRVEDVAESIFKEAADGAKLRSLADVWRDGVMVQEGFLPIEAWIRQGEL